MKIDTMCWWSHHVTSHVYIFILFIVITKNGVPPLTGISNDKSFVMLIKSFKSRHFHFVPLGGTLYENISGLPSYDLNLQHHFRDNWATKFIHVLNNIIYNAVVVMSLADSAE